MWVLRSSRGGLYYLFVGKSHVVSRRDGDLILADDQSISRRHAVITVEHNIKDLGNPSKLPVVSLMDTGSKYGTFINDGIEASSRLAKDCTVTLSNGDRIRFGLQWNEWRLEYVPLVITASTLTPDEKKSLKQQIMMLGGHIVSTWQDLVTHVTMCSLTLTVKVVCALANGKPIVTPQYWDDYITSLSTKQPIPDCKDYIPALAETTLNMNEVSFDVNENRKKLFAGKRFVFVSSHQYDAYSCMVTAAGGRAHILQQNGMAYEDLVQPNVIVMQYLFNKPSQETQVPQSFQEVTKYLKSRGKRVIPESDIGLAILHCSIDRHCNPDYRVASVLITKGTRNVSHSEVVLVLDTQDSESQSIKRIREAAKDIVIPESGTVQKSAGPSVTSAPKDVMNDRESMETKNVNVSIPGRRMEKERLPVQDEMDASFVSRKRFRSLEDDGFLKKRVAAVVPEESHVTVKLEVDVKKDSDDEDLFEFPSDKKSRLTACEPANEDEDIFAFADDVKPKPLQLHVQKDHPVESSDLPKKRKFENGDTTCELNSFNKRPALEKDVHLQQITEKNEPMEHSVSPAGFLTVVQGSKMSG